MMSQTSPARIASNRANAAASTGPKTEAGKSRSRLNALKHGLTAQVVEVDCVPAASAPVLTTTGKLDPVWIASDIQRTAAQIERAHRIEAKLRAEARFRADTYWADDRLCEVALLGAKLKRNPEWTVARLRLSPQGCSWLIERWKCLRRAAIDACEWDEAQTTLAFDLLGVPSEGRDCSVEAAIAHRQQASGPATTPRDVADAMLAELGEQREFVEEADEVARRLTLDDSVDLPTPELARVRRYDLALKKHLGWLIEQLRDGDPLENPAATAPAVIEPVESPPPVVEPPTVQAPPEPQMAGSKLFGTNPTEPGLNAAVATANPPSTLQAAPTPPESAVIPHRKGRFY